MELHYQLTRLKILEKRAASHSVSILKKSSNDIFKNKEYLEIKSPLVAITHI